MRYFAAEGRWKGDFWGCTQYGKTGCRGKINVAGDEVKPQQAGASAQERFERERAAHRAKLRATLPLLAIATLVVMATAFFGVAPFNPLLASGISLAAGLFCLFFISRLPSEAVYWDKGARGERKTAEYLDPLVTRGFVILHDRKIPGSKANIDHVAIGPSGVYVIETKYISGTIDVINDRLYVSDHDRQKYVEEVYRESLTAQMALSEPLNRLRLTVTPVLCIHGAKTPRFDHSVAGVRLLSAHQLRKIVEGAPELLSSDQVQELATLADLKLRGMYSWER